MGVRFDMIGLFVKDVPAMVAFYRDVIGLETDWDGRSPAPIFRHEGIRLMMYPRALLPDLMPGEEPTFPAGLNGTFELALDVPLYKDVDVEYARLVAAGARPVYAPRNEPWGMRSAMVADPDGNLIEVASSHQE